jgi:hypothetical protein
MSDRLRKKKIVAGAFVVLGLLGFFAANLYRSFFLENKLAVLAGTVVGALVKSVQSLQSFNLPLGRGLQAKEDPALGETTEIQLPKGRQPNLIKKLEVKEAVPFRKLANLEVDHPRDPELALGSKSISCALQDDDEAHYQSHETEPDLEAGMELWTEGGKLCAERKDDDRRLFCRSLEGRILVNGLAGDIDPTHIYSDFQFLHANKFEGADLGSITDPVSGRISAVVVQTLKDFNGRIAVKTDSVDTVQGGTGLLVLRANSIRQITNVQDLCLSVFDKIHTLQDIVGGLEIWGPKSRRAEIDTINNVSGRLSLHNVHVHSLKNLHVDSVDCENSIIDHQEGGQKVQCHSMQH